MKTVANLADATRLAARNGATLAVGGRLVNAAGARLDVVPRPAPRAPEPPPAPPPDTPAPASTRDERMDQLVALVAAQGRSTAEVLVQMLSKLQAPPPVKTKLRPASFAVVRDAEGMPTALSPTYETGTPSRPVRFDVVLGDDGFAASLIPVY